MGAALEIRPAYPGQQIKVVTDLDDCVFKRERTTRVLGQLIRKVRPHSLSRKTLEDFSELDHTPIDRPVRGLERISASFHLKRKPIDGVVDPLKKVIAENGLVIAASGRRAKTKWDSGTRNQAERANLHFTDIVLTPEGVSGKVSKAKTIRRVQATHYLEDDADTIKYVNRENPGLQIIHIDHGQHLDRQYLAENPNITVVPAAELYRRRQAKKDKVLGVSETRNSVLREIVSTPVQTITCLVHKLIPGLTPTHLNILGAVEVGAGAVEAARGNKVIAAALIVKGSLMDAFDGALARLMAAEDPKSVDFKKGGLYDVISDRVQELALALSRAWSAEKRGSKLGALAALAAAISNPMPSVVRSFSEMRGKPVPESGKGILGLIGTRPGRALLGGIATLFPVPKGIPFQLGADVLTTVANVKTTVDRLRTAFSKKESTLSKEVRKDAKIRLTVLGIFTTIALAGSLFTYLRMNRRHEEKPSVTESLKNNDYLDVVCAVERYCKENNLDHRFVGGAVTNLIGTQTEFAIDISKRTVKLKNPNNPSLIRDEDRTPRDIDLIVFSPDRAKYESAKKVFKQWEVEARKLGKVFPQISIEAAYHPDWASRKSWRQFVTAFEIDQQGIPSLAFGKVKTEIKPESIEPWKIRLENGTEITTFNFLGHTLCYGIRASSGIKDKDRAKLELLKNFASQVYREGLRNGVNYDETYEEWINYIWTLHNEPDPLTWVKSGITKIYWNTIGTQASHGSGVFKRFTVFSNKFAGQ